LEQIGKLLKSNGSDQIIIIMHERMHAVDASAKDDGDGGGDVFSW
jgi:hypothetical protein